uniref:Uncharacterized protein n=1 Tax=Chlamydomonas leiostraca TaxID=1034604 RepID=A0A7S0RY68_9CHLO|mmetsp:Transcript_3477/g.8674  ORF Transcript_3477/g.8674 Transcript_3477/m.8674 type:complete len:394 (+) Transcript_3477:185-1366(+)
MASNQDVHKELEALADQAQSFLRRSSGDMTSAHEHALDMDLGSMVAPDNQHAISSPGGSFSAVAAAVTQHLHLLESKHQQWRHEGKPSTAESASDPSTTEAGVHPAGARAFDTLMQALLRVLHLSVSYDTQRIRSMKPGDSTGSSAQAASAAGSVRAAQHVALDLLHAVPAISRLAFNEFIAGYDGMMRVHEVYTAILDALTGQPGGAPATQMPLDMQRELSRRLSVDGGAAGGPGPGSAGPTSPLGSSGRQLSAHPQDLLALVRSPSPAPPTPAPPPTVLGGSGSGGAQAARAGVRSHPLLDGGAGEGGGVACSGEGEGGGGQGEDEEDDPHELAQAALLQAAAMPLDTRGCAHVRTALQKRPCMVLLRMVLRLKEKVAAGEGSAGGASMQQ